MAKEIVWNKRATSQFNNLIDFLDQEWGERVTMSFVQRTYDVIDLLSAQPELGTLENSSKNIRGFLLTKHNRIFYRVTEKQLIILSLFDTRSGSKRKKF